MLENRGRGNYLRQNGGRLRIPFGPKLDNVVSFSNWARAHGQWSDYPSVGAWTNFGNGHCELVVGFDADTVRTKGGNSAKAGATESISLTVTLECDTIKVGKAPSAPPVAASAV